MTDAESDVTALLAVLDEVEQASSALYTPAHELAIGADEAFTRLENLFLYEDPFGQPEPRRVLFPYARAATVVQFLATDLTVRRHRAAEATAFLQARLADWEQMQRARLAGHSEDEIQTAIDAIGEPELRRLFDAWARLGTATLPAVP
jgi:hypothetical protein